MNTETADYKPDLPAKNESRKEQPMSKHTPGPWRWWACKETESASNDYIQIAAGLKHVAQIKIASITEHDMRLIAAAPELLDALKLMRDAFLDTEGSHGTLEQTATDAADAAIAKATGEQA